MANLSTNAQELFEALQWKLDNGDCGNSHKRQKIEGLCEWYADKNMFTEKQIEFANQLLGE